VGDYISLPEFTEEAVLEHNTKEDCWVALHGYIYNVTEFMKKHPGGEMIFLE